MILKVSASEKRVIYVLKLSGPSLPAYFHRFHKRICKELRQNPPESSSGPLRANTTKGRSPLHFQSDQILELLICVSKNLMITSSTFIHIDRWHSHDKDSLSGRWPLRQAAKRVTSSLRDIPGARAPPHSQTRSCKFRLLTRIGASILGV